jgi:hypothetical protein
MVHKVTTGLQQSVPQTTGHSSLLPSTCPLNISEDAGFFMKKHKSRFSRHHILVLWLVPGGSLITAITPLDSVKTGLLLGPHLGHQKAKSRRNGRCILKATQLFVQFLFATAFCCLTFKNSAFCPGNIFVCYCDSDN